MNILHISECAGGVERYLSMLIPRLQERGVKQSFVCSHSYDVDKYEKWCEVIRMNLKRSFSPKEIIKQVKSIRQEIRRIKPDVIYCHSSFAGGLGRLAVRGLDCRVVYNPHGWAFQIKGGKMKSVLYLTIERLLARWTDLIICISNFECMVGVWKGVARPEKIRLILNGIDFDEVEHQVNLSDITRHSLGIAKDAFVVGMVGRISKQKAPDVFIDMAAEVKKQEPLAHFVIVGGDKRKDTTIERRIAQHGLSNCFTIIEWTDKPLAYASLFDVAVLLSRWEGFGLVLVEYMKLEKPIVATAVDAIPELIIDRENGLLVPPNTSQEAAKAVMKIHDDRPLKHHIIKNAKERVAILYDIERVAQQHITLFQKLIRSRDD